MSDKTSIEERAKIRCSCCGTAWEEHPTDTVCWRYRPRPEPPPNGAPPEPPKGTIPGHKKLETERYSFKWMLQEARAEAHRLRVELAETTAELLEAREEIGRLVGENTRLRTRMAL